MFDEAIWDSLPQVFAETIGGDINAVGALARRVVDFLLQEMERLGVP
jgi:hypothetical protein